MIKKIFNFIAEIKKTKFKINFLTPNLQYCASISTKLRAIYIYIYIFSSTK